MAWLVPPDSERGRGSEGERKREICTAGEGCCGRLENVDEGDGRGRGGRGETLVDTVATKGGTDKMTANKRRSKDVKLRNQ